MKKMFIFVSHVLLAGIIFTLLTSCCKHCDPVVVKEQKKAELIFKAFNLSLDNIKPAYTGSPVVTNTTNVTITINGVSHQYTKTTKSYELLVVPGNEIEIKFESSCSEETEATFTLPDGTVHKVSATSSSFKWIIPEEVKTGDKIIGESQYETEYSIFNASSEIILISLLDGQ